MLNTLIHVTYSLIYIKLFHQGQKLCEHDFAVTGDPKGPLLGPTFWWGFETQDPCPLGAELEK